VVVGKEAPPPSDDVQEMRLMHGCVCVVIVDKRNRCVGDGTITEAQFRAIERFADQEACKWVDAGYSIPLGEAAPDVVVVNEKGNCAACELARPEVCDCIRMNHTFNAPDGGCVRHYLVVDKNCKTYDAVLFERPRRTSSYGTAEEARSVSPMDASAARWSEEAVRIRAQRSKYPRLHVEFVKNGMNVGVRHGGDAVEILCETDAELERARQFVACFSQQHPQHPDVLRGIKLIIWRMPVVFS